VRIGQKTLSPTDTTFVDLGDGTERRDLARFSTLGAYVVVGGLIGGTLADRVVVTGAQVTPNDPGDTNVDVAAGKVYSEEVSGEVTIAAVANLALAAGHATDERIDIVQVNVSTGAATKKDGTAHATAPTVPAPDAGNITLATVYRHPDDDLVRTTDDEIIAADITDVAPRG
jgi:hypothetical protein